MAEIPAARAACLFWVRHFVLCLRLVESEVSVCGPGGNPQASVVFASLPDTVLALTHTYVDAVWRATRFSLRDLAGWEYGASHLSKVSAAYMQEKRKPLRSFHCCLLRINKKCAPWGELHLQTGSESNSPASFPA